jgi:hypothetical protein
MNNVVSKYVKKKHEIWNEKKPPKDECLQEIFEHFKQEDIVLQNISTVPEFSLPLPGTNAHMEKSIFTGESLMDR